MYYMFCVFFLFIFALVIKAGEALASVAGIMMWIALVGEALLAICFVVDKIKHRVGVHPILSVISSVMCISTSYWVLDSLRSSDGSIGSTIIFLITLVILGGSWFAFIFCNWIIVNTEQDDVIEIGAKFLFETIASGAFLWLYLI